MVRLGLLDASDDDEEFTTARSPYAAPTEADDSEDEQPHAAADRTPRRSFSPGGLFSRSDGSGRAEASPGARPARPHEVRGEVRGEEAGDGRVQARAHVPAPPLLDCGLPQRLYGYAPLSPGRGCARRAARRIDGHLKTSL